MLHQLRRAMVQPGRDRLADEVELDESYVGDVATGKRGRGAAKKVIATSAVEQRERGMGRVRLARVPDITAESLETFVEDAVERTAVVYTDGYGGYAGLAPCGYTHVPTAISDSGDAHVVMPRVHPVASLLERWLLGTRVRCAPQHLDDYLHEFALRFNRRGSSRRGLLFYRLLEKAVQLGHVPLSAIVGRRR